MTYTLHTPNLQEGTISSKKEEIRKYFLKTYQLNEQLFELLKDKNTYIYEQPNKLRHPLIFYYGHTATFFINKLRASNIITHRINEYFESIFAIGVDEMSWDDLDKKHYKWPQFEEIKKYRNLVKNEVLKIIDTIEFTMPITWDSPMWIILMGIEHENIHIETTSVLLRELDIKFLTDKNIFPYVNDGTKTFPQNELLNVKGGEILLQKNRNNPKYYGWDNEFSFHRDTLKDFQASKYLVSNGEFLEFVKDGGYNKSEFFSNEGKEWLNFSQAKHPIFWVKKDNEFFLREINRLIPLPLNYPVDVNFYEAEAFCAYKSKKLGLHVRLPSEDEYYRIYDFTHASKQEANIGLIRFNQSPVDKYKFNDFYDVKGNVWQWSLTPMYPYDDFKTHPSYDDFTTPTFDDRHILIKGGSFVSLGNETLRSARYAFRKHFFQHAGFRYVHSNNEYRTTLNDNVYEKDALISQYCEFHYGKEYYNVKNFPKNSILQLATYLKNAKKTKALDLGCSVGRSTFELAKLYDEVIGIDFSANFINIGVKLKQYDSLTYKIPQEGEIFEEKTIALSTLGLDKVKEKVSFMQGDACNLKDIYSGFDLIFCSNLIDRLYYPQKFINDVQKRVNNEGYLVILSPYTWLEEYTPKNNWLGGYIKNGKKIKTLDTLKKSLHEFTLIDTIDIPFVIRETKRKYQHSISQMSIWKKECKNT